MTPAEAIADLKQMSGILANATLAPAMRDCQTIVQESIGGNFDSESTPDGAKWPARKHIGDGHPLLDDTGFLKAAATGQGPGAISDVQQREMTIGIDTSVNLGGIAAALIHNEGLGNMPQRKFYEPTETALDECGETIADYLFERMLG